MQARCYARVPMFSAFAMSDTAAHVIAFYDVHPISHEHVLHQVRERRGSLEDLAPADLYPFDQDHYGGLAANDALADAAHLARGAHVVDLCAGLGGPARYQAATRGVIVTCVELNARRASAARDLSFRVGLGEQVRVVRGDVTRIPLRGGCADAVLSQEALLHVPDKSAVLREAARVLRPGGRIAFTDWVEWQPLNAVDRGTLWDGIAAQDIYGNDRYVAALAAAGFTGVRCDDITRDWGGILSERLRMYRALRDAAARAGNPRGDDSFYSAYVRLVELVVARRLGGVRFSATRR